MSIPAHSLEFEGRQVPVEPTDTIASALYRAGVRVFSRSFKYHRPRGLYCLTGDCPNCLVTVDDEPAVRACCTSASDVRRVARGNAWPSADVDALSILWHVRAMLPVGFYYKTLIRPRFAWPLAEPIVRRIAGLGPVPRQSTPAHRERLTHHPEVLVIGGGVAGLAAAGAASEHGAPVVLVDEGRIGERVAPGDTRRRIDWLRDGLRARPHVTVLERATAVGIYEGRLVPVVADDALHLVLPQRVIVATGAAERHAVFPGNDLPGVWLGRGAARMAGVHQLALGARVVMVIAADEGLEHLAALRASSVTVIAPAAIASRLPSNVRVLEDYLVREAKGRRHIRAVVVESPHGTRHVVPCDALVLSLGVEPRDGLLRQVPDPAIRGAGDVVTPGCTLDEAEAAGAGSTPVSRPMPYAFPADARGFVCLCEDVGADELEHAWHEGYQSTELLKRYTTTTMGACQGALCHPHLRAFACARTTWDPASAPTTARPPARALRVEDLAAGTRRPVEYRTSLHERHVAHGATFEWAGVWRRPERYGDALAEYWAVRRNVSIMDVSTLGKYRVAGRDAAAFLERLYPCRIHDLAPGRSRYALLLNETGYIVDDGLVCALGDHRYYLTFTSAGGDRAEAWLRDWAETWGSTVHIANVTAATSAINVAGPRARDLLERLTRDPVDAKRFPYGGVREIVVAGVPCLALRVGFVGELSFELHHPSRQSPALWDALMTAGQAYGLVPHGLDALRLLRLEKGHIIVGQDTDFDTTPARVGLARSIRMDKPDFVGRLALEHLSSLPHERSLLAIAFDGPRAPVEGAQLFAGSTHLGSLTSSRFSPVLGFGIGLGWARHPNGQPPARVVARDSAGDVRGAVVHGPFYDPAGERLRA